MVKNNIHMYVLEGDFMPRHNPDQKTKLFIRIKLSFPYAPILLIYKTIVASKCSSLLLIKKFILVSPIILVHRCLRKS